MPPNKQFQARLPAVAVSAETFAFIKALSVVRSQYIGETERQALEYYRQHFAEVAVDEQSAVQAILDQQGTPEFDSEYRKVQESDK